MSKTPSRKGRQCNEHWIKLAFFNTGIALQPESTAGIILVELLNFP